MTGTTLTISRDFAPGLSLRSFSVNGQPWFIAKDVCDVLGLGNVAQALSKLDEDERGITDVDTLGGTQSVSTVNESGLYALVFKSRKAQAKAFKKWVTSVVLPAVRKDGGYIRGEELLQVEGLSIAELEAREVLLASGMAAVLTRKRQRLFAIEERHARDEAFRFLKTRG